MQTWLKNILNAIDFLYVFKPYLHKFHKYWSREDNMYDYVKQQRWARIRVGIVITVAIGIIFLTILFAGNIERALAPKARFYATFTDIRGLREGAPVWFSGVEIGSVKSINFNTEKMIEVEMSVSSEALRFFKQDSRANILTLGLLGDKYVEITPGSREAEGLRSGGTVTGQTTIEVQDVVRTGQESIAKISDFVNILDGILVKIEKGEGTLSKLLNDPALYDNLKDTTEETVKLLKKIESGKGTISRLLNDETLYTDISSSVKDINLFAKSLRDSQGTLNKLINDPSLYDRFQKASENLDAFTGRLNTSKGTLNSIIEDESLYGNVNSVSEKLGLLLDRIERGEGLAGKLVKDDELAQNLRSTLTEMNALIKDIKENPRKYFKFSIF
ncbi:MAG: MCE family protein [Nitrospiraceae bacterium]|nr:MAG: MCE family protein [Nitrospiraceae bacterium]